jgi:hypothetical protein
MKVSVDHAAARLANMATLDAAAAAVGTEIGLSLNCFGCTSTE